MTGVGIPLYPAPYSPQANNPTDMTPQAPQVPWTEIAPATSSTPTFSKKAALYTTRTPAITPINDAPIGVTNAQGAVIATRPARNPLHIIGGSHFPDLPQYTIIETMDAMIDAMAVFT